MSLTSNSPLLERVIDESVMAARVGEVLQSVPYPARPLREFHVPRVFPRPDGSVHIQYTFLARIQKGADPQRVILFAVHYPDGALPVKPDEDDEIRFVDMDDLQLRLWLFPHDPKLNDLQAFLQPKRFARLFGADLIRSGITYPAEQVHVATLGYRLGRRFVARVSWDDGGPELVAKMTKPRTAMALWGKLRQLERNGFETEAIDLPKTRLFHPPSGTVFQEFAPGDSLHDLMPLPSFIVGCEAAAEILGRLSRLQITGLAAWTVSDELDVLGNLTEASERFYPEIGRRARTVLERLSATPPHGGQPLVAHRDFYDKQVLVTDERTLLLDCDTLTLADPALDYGNFVAHLDWRMRQEPSLAGTIGRGAEAFRRVYEAPDAGFAERARWWEQAATLRIACIYAWRPRWRHLVADHLASHFSVKSMRQNVAGGIPR